MGEAPIVFPFKSNELFVKYEDDQIISKIFNAIFEDDFNGFEKSNGVFKPGTKEINNGQITFTLEVLRKINRPVFRICNIKDRKISCSLSIDSRISSFSTAFNDSVPDTEYFYKCISVQDLDAFENQKIQLSFPADSLTPETMICMWDSRLGPETEPKNYNCAPVIFFK